jgi:hypothetical protein
LIPNPDWELNAIAISLMRIGKFANPYMLTTGPTAHLPPIYPFIFSLIYRLFGLTSKAGFVSMLFIIVTGSILYAMLPWVSYKFGISRQAGFIGGIAGALLVEWPGHGEYPTGIVMALLLIAFVNRWSENRLNWSSSLLLGLFIGASFHLQPALLPVILGCIIFEMWWYRYEKRKWALLILLILAAVLALLPWTWRNYKTFNSIFFIRSNFGLELRMGNHEGAMATMEEMDAAQEHRHPRTHFEEARLMQEVGEIEYMRRAGREAIEWIVDNPGKFFCLSFLRFVNLWAGPLHRPLAAAGVLILTILTLWGGWKIFPGLTLPQKAVILIPLITYPLVYYFVAYMPRYRVPIDWILFMLSGAAVWSWLKQ